MLSLFRSVSGGENWGVLESWLIQLSDFHRLLFIFLLYFTMLGVLSIVTGLFCEGAAEMTRLDKDKMLMQKKEEQLKAQRQIRAIFKAIDADESGQINETEFLEVLQDGELLEYFARMDLDKDEVAS